jgi:hypothetical protein
VAEGGGGAGPLPVHTQPQWPGTEGAAERATEEATPPWPPAAGGLTLVATSPPLAPRPGRARPRLAIFFSENDKIKFETKVGQVSQHEIVIPNPSIFGLFHLSGHPISKYDLLLLISRIYNRQVDVQPIESPKINRSLNLIFFFTLNYILK